MSARITNSPFSVARRKEILDERQAAYDLWLESGEETPEGEQALDRVAKLNSDYRNGLPVVRFCLSPIDGLPFDHSIDTFGLDGLWWNYMEFLRPQEYLPTNVVAFAGALTLNPPTEKTSFLCKPGPGIPFVVPSLLNQEGVVAVLCPIAIGKHQGWPVIYFKPDQARIVGGFNTWGVSFSQFMHDKSFFGWSEWDAGEDDYDFNLKPWIQSGKLWWVDPEDSEGKPKQGVEGFPWLSLTGEKLLQLVQGGRVLTQVPVVVTEWEEEGSEQSSYWEYAEGFGPQDQEASDVEDDDEQLVQAPQTPEPPPAAERVPPVVQQAPGSPTPPPKAKFCRGCGALLKSGASFCSGCGTKV